MRILILVFFCFSPSFSQHYGFSLTYLFVFVAKVPPDIIAQVRYVNEQRAVGRKASRPKDMKRILSEKKLLVKPEVLAATGLRVRWVEQSSETPPVRAIVTVMKDGVDVDLPITDWTTTAHVLQVSKVALDVIYLQHVSMPHKPRPDAALTFFSIPFKALGDGQNLSLSECGGNIGER